MIAILSEGRSAKLVVSESGFTFVAQVAPDNVEFQMDIAYLILAMLIIHLYTCCLA